MQVEVDDKVVFEPEIPGPSAPRGAPAGKPLRPLRHALPNNGLCQSSEPMQVLIIVGRGKLRADVI